MSTKTVNISFQKSLLDDIDRTARSESRSRSELLREAARAYIERKSRWDDIFAFGERQARRRELRPDDVTAEIASYRKDKGKAPGR